jgi:hypothetical protein
MNMRMHDSLTGGLSHVHTHVISLWMQIAIQLCLGLPEQFKRRSTLIVTQLEKVGNMTEGNDQ